MHGEPAGKPFLASLHKFNLFWDTSRHNFSSLPRQTTPVLNQFVKLNTLNFIASLFRHIALYLNKRWQKAYGTLALTNIQASVKSSVVGAAALVLSWISYSRAKRCMQSFSFKRKLISVPSTEVTATFCKEHQGLSWAHVQMLQLQAKLQHHLEAGQTLPSEWACFPERLSD